MVDQLKELLRMIAEDDEVFALGAKIKKKTFDALVAEGFSSSKLSRSPSTAGTS